VFEQLQSNDLVLSVRPNHVYAEFQTLPETPLRAPGHRVRTATPIAHIDCQRASPTVGNQRRSVGALQHTQIRPHRQGTTELPATPHHPSTPPKSAATGILRGRDSTSGPPPTQALQAPAEAPSPAPAALRAARPARTSPGTAVWHASGNCDRWPRAGLGSGPRAL